MRWLTLLSLSRQAPRRRAALVVATAAFTAAACAAVPATRPAGSADVGVPAGSSAPVVPVRAELGAPAALTGPASASAGGVAGSSATAGVGIAFPYPGYPGVPGMAPDHTIVVTGTGQAKMRADGSDQAAAQTAALDDALADAKSQAATIAAATGVTLAGVLSASASVMPNWPYAVPMEQGTVPAVPGSPSQPGTGAPGPAIRLPLELAPGSGSIAVTVTVAYSIR